MNEVLRQEYKYLISQHEFIKYRHTFSTLLKNDIHNSTDGYMVRSLYFDTQNDKDFWEKEDGLETRKKIRLRIYNCDSGFAVLEMKQKQGTEQKKRSLQILKDDAIKMTHGNYTPLLGYKNPFAAECFALMSMEGYRPKAIVQYNRFAFIANENKIRITFDNRIEATESSFDIFSEKLNLYPVLSPFCVVLEVKYNGFLLSYIRDTINICNRSSLSVSKYALGRIVSLNYIF